ncbi:MAG TPA: hypothetical protein VMH85_01285 [Terriglobales bacterium]|nr:hypothetical protein [Terriglobales bacterium]
MDSKRWTCALVCALLLSSTAAWSASSKYTHLEDSTLVDNGVVGWGSCVICAGGSSILATIASSPFQTSPSKDGSSRDFLISGNPYSNGLWWYKVGPNDAATTFTFDFWLNVAANTQAAQAMEFDTFQFISGREYMFGTQCDYASGTWDLWNAGTLKWAHSKIACKKFAANTWYHITLAFHRTTSDNAQHYDSLTIVQYKANGKVASNNTYNFKTTYASQFTPPGWGDDLGVQFQMDIGGTGATMQEWVDQVTLTAK